MQDTALMHVLDTTRVRTTLHTCMCVCTAVHMYACHCTHVEHTPHVCAGHRTSECGVEIASMN